MALPSIQSHILCQHVVEAVNYIYVYSYSLFRHNTCTQSTGLIDYIYTVESLLKKGHLPNEDTVFSPINIELCTNLPLNWGHFSIQDSQLGHNGFFYREVPLYSCTYIQLNLSINVTPN